MKKVANNSQYMKKNNRMEILNIIRKEKISRAGLSRETGLTRAAISLIIDKLIEDNIIFESTTEDAELGRKPIQLEINENRFYAMGLDISREHIYLGAININGKLLYKEKLDFDDKTDIYKILDTITERITNVQKTKPFSGDLIGLGISAPGPINIKEGIILNPPNFNKWHNIEVVKYLEKALRLDIFLDNNAIAQTLVEKNYGLGTSYHNYMVIMTNEGIGGGIVLQDKLYRGVNGFGNEIGHITVDINGEKCDCGNYGCLELYAGLSSVLKNNFQNDEGINSWEDIVDRATEGDQRCLSIIEKEASYLSTAILSCLNILELETIILKGSICYKSDLLLNEIKDFVWSRAITRSYREKIPIHISPDIKDNEIIAAATIIIDKFFAGELAY